MPGSQGSQLASGDILEERFRIEEKLGEGGFGAVFRATQLNIDRKVAIKVVHPQLLTMTNGIERFMREVRVAQRLEHPNTVRMYDFGHTKDGAPYIAWELLKGQPLDEIVEEGIPVSVDRVVRIATQVLKALMEAHAQGIIHRDIKPANIFLTDFSGEPDYVKVLDFGIAKALDQTEEAGAKALTMVGQIIGTPNYMAPEQVEGKEVGASADLYSLGIVMTELLTGQAVFTGTCLAICAAQLSPEPVPIRPDILNLSVGPIISKATQKNLEYRYSTAQEMLTDLRALSQNLGDDTGTFGSGFTGAGQPMPTTSGGAWSSSPSSSPGAVVSPTSQPAMLQPTGTRALGGGGGLSRFKLAIIGGIAGMVVFGLIVTVVVAIAVSGGNPPRPPHNTTQQVTPNNTTQNTIPNNTNTQSNQNYPTHWGPQPNWNNTTNTNPGANSNLINVTPELLSQRMQASGYSLMNQPTVQNSPYVRTIIMTGMRNNTAASVMFYDYQITAGFNMLLSSLSQQEGALSHDGQRLLYVRVMGTNGGTAASQQLLAAILQ